jgi:CheY-like chemotaxis protein
VLARYALLRPAQPSGAPITALAIDDDPTSLAIVSTCLEQEGIAVSTADNGADGLRKARGQRFDVIVCDLLMPDIDGFTVIAELQDDPKTRSVPILVVTAQDLTEADKMRLNGNILGIVQKGAALEASVRRWLGRLETSVDLVEGAS